MKRRRPQQPMPQAFWHYGPSPLITMAALILAVVGFLAGRASLLFLGLFLGALIVIARFMVKASLEHVSLHTELSQLFIDPGATTSFELVVTNPLPWPLLQGEWSMSLPSAIQTQGPGHLVAAPGDRQVLKGQFWVGPRQKVRLFYEIRGLKRGRWRFGEASVTFRDPLAWHQISRQDPVERALTVWPQRYAVPPNFWLTQDRVEGRVQGSPWDLPDPLNVVGVRPYQPGDPLRLISPHASARLHELMVKELQPVRERSIHVFVHPKTTDHHWQGIDRRLLEDTINAAASLVAAALGQGARVHLTASGAHPGQLHGFSIRAQGGRDPAPYLTALAWLQPSGSMDDDLQNLLSPVLAQRHRTNNTIVLVSPYWPEWMRHVRLDRASIIFVQPDYGDDVRSPQGIVTWHYHEGVWSHA